MSRNPEKVDRKTLLFLVPTLSIFTGLMLFIFFIDGHWTTGRVVFISILIVTTLMMVLTFLNQNRFWWAPRVVALMFLAAVVGSMVFVFLADMQLGRKESLALAISLLVLGVPSALFALWGSTSGKVSSPEMGLTPAREKLLLISIQIAKWLSLAAVLVLGVLLVIEIFLGN